MSDFNFFITSDIPDDILKASQNEKGDKRYENMVIEGVASTDEVDSSGESLDPQGYEFDDFIKYGKVNLEHFPARKGDPYYWIGDVVDAKVEGNKFIVKSKLWSKHPLARSFWDTMIAMKESGAKNMPGYSIEGKKQQIDPRNKKRITKAKINNIAVTFTPVLKSSLIDIAKGVDAEDYINSESKENIFLYKSEYAGKIITVNSDLNIIIEKAMGLDELKPLLKESVKRKIIDITSAGTLYEAAEKGKLNDKAIAKLIKKLKKND